MPQFRYRAVTPAGKMVAGEVEAPSREEVIRRIEYLGHLPIEAQLAAPKGFSLSFGSKIPRSPDSTLFLRQLARLIAAGFPLEVARQSLAEDPNKAVGKFADDLRSSISTGQSFAEALERY